MNDLRRAIAAAVLGDAVEDPPGTAVRRFRFPGSFLGFSGHFPGNPILPAVVQMQTVVSIAEERAGTPLRLTEIRSAKFLFPVLPEKDVVFRVRPTENADGWACDAEVSVDGKTAAAFALVLSSRGAPG